MNLNWNKKYCNKLYQTLMNPMFDNPSEQERKNIQNEKEQIKQDYKTFY